MSYDVKLGRKLSEPSTSGSFSRNFEKCASSFIMHYMLSDIRFKIINIQFTILLAQSLFRWIKRVKLPFNLLHLNLFLELIYFLK